jgi:hypothetical protein
MNHTDFTIHPFEGVGAVRFGMTPQQVHEIWGEPDRTYKHESVPYKCHTDYYQKMGIHVDYDDSGVCEHISLLSHINDSDQWNTNARNDEDDDWPEDTLQYGNDKSGIFVEDKLDCSKDKMERGQLEDPVKTCDDDSDYTINPTFQERELYGQTMGEFKSWLKGLGSAIQHTDTGFIFLKFGIGAHSQYYYAPYRNPDCLVEMVTVFPFDYKDKFAEDLMKDGYCREEPPAGSENDS